LISESGRNAGPSKPEGGVPLFSGACPGMGKNRFGSTGDWPCFAVMTWCAKTRPRRQHPGRSRKGAKKRAPSDLAVLAVRSLKTALDSMNEMSEMTSLRLQMTMDRRSKFIATISNIMKKISTTEKTLLKNIK